MRLLDYSWPRLPPGTMLIAVRRWAPLLTVGVGTAPQRHYKRAWEGQQILVALNIAPQPRGAGSRTGTRIWLACLDGRRPDLDNTAVLRGEEGILVTRRLD